MLALIQRVSHAHVEVGGDLVGSIDAGLVVLVCAEPTDTEPQADRLVDKLLTQRIFADAQGRMNLDVRDVSGGLLIVPQFTLAADTAGGNRPSFSGAAAPELGRRLYERVLATARASHPVVQAGRFGAHMKVHLVNDGPVTIALTVR
jgi:D-tyrosyl-tRNA(Tyr) deacylase